MSHADLNTAGDFYENAYKREHRLRHTMEDEIAVLRAEVDRYREALDTTGRYVANALDSLGELPEDEPSNTAAYLMSAQMALAAGGDPE